VPASQVGANTNAAIPLMVMDDVQLTQAIQALARLSLLEVEKCVSG